MATTIADSLRDSHMLIILDNCEQVTDGAVDVVEVATATAPFVRFLATSREALGVDGELVIALPELDAAAAMTLFEERSQATGSGSGSELGEDRATVGELCWLRSAERSSGPSPK